MEHVQLPRDYRSGWLRHPFDLRDDLSKRISAASDHPDANSMHEAFGNTYREPRRVAVEDKRRFWREDGGGQRSGTPVSCRCQGSILWSWGWSIRLSEGRWSN